MRAVFLSLCAALWCGCFAFDEIDKGMEIMDAHTSTENRKKEEARKAAEAAGRGEDEKPPTYAEKVGEWWQDATSLSSKPNASAEPFVSCTAGGKTFYTKRSDCAARGGRAG